MLLTYMKSDHTFIVDFLLQITSPCSSRNLRRKKCVKWRANSWRIWSPLAKDSLSLSRWPNSSLWWNSAAAKSQGNVEAVFVPSRDIDTRRLLCTVNVLGAGCLWNIRIGYLSDTQVLCGDGKISRWLCLLQISHGSQSWWQKFTCTY